MKNSAESVHKIGLTASQDRWQLAAILLAGGWIGAHHLVQGRWWGAIVGVVYLHLLIWGPATFGLSWIALGIALAIELAYIWVG